MDAIQNQQIYMVLSALGSLGSTGCWVRHGVQFARPVGTASLGPRVFQREQRERRRLVHGQGPLLTVVRALCNRGGSTATSTPTRTPNLPERLAAGRLGLEDLATKMFGLQYTSDANAAQGYAVRWGSVQLCAVLKKLNSCNIAHCHVTSW